MGKIIAAEDTIFEGQFYKQGSELPEHQPEMAKGKTHLGSPGGSYANQVAGAALPQHQENRPGMSGSGKPQTADIVTGLGEVTKEGEDEGTEKAAKEAEKSADKAAKEREKDEKGKGK